MYMPANKFKIISLSANVNPAEINEIIGKHNHKNNECLDSITYALRLN